MLFSQAKKTAAPKKLHTITGLISERRFLGQFQFAGADYSFVYAPAKGEIAGGKFALIGKLTITDSRGVARSIDNLRATLSAVQGATGGAPVRPTQGDAISRFEQQRSKSAASPLPITEATDALSSTGVMYFHFDPIKTRLTLAPADLASLQFNARFAPVDDTARALHGICCSIVDATIGKHADAEAAAALVAQFNRQLTV